MGEPISFQEARRRALKVMADSAERVNEERRREFEEMRCQDCIEHEAELTRLREQLRVAREGLSIMSVADPSDPIWFRATATDTIIKIDAVANNHPKKYGPDGMGPPNPNVTEDQVWVRVCFSSDCDEDGNCPNCGIDYADCPCPGPTQDGYAYMTDPDGVLWATRKPG